MIPKLETATIKTEQEVIRCRRIETTHNIQTNKIKTTEVVHQNINDE